MLHDVYYFLQVVYSLEVIHDLAHFFAVVHTYFNGSIKDSLVTLNGNLVDVDVHFVGNHISKVVKHALAVYSFDFNSGVKEQPFVHIPLGVKNSVAVA